MNSFLKAVGTFVVAHFIGYLFIGLLIFNNVKLSLISIVGGFVWGTVATLIIFTVYWPRSKDDPYDKRFI